MKSKVAAVCVRQRSEDVECLLVRTSGGRRWTFPKGGVEDGERPEEAAAREAMEEAGASGEVDPEPLGTYLYPGGSETDAEHVVTAFLIRVVADDGPHEEGREPAWFAVGRAREKLAKRRSEEAASAHGRIIDAAVGRLRKKMSKIS